jgi:hypothetical protein
MGRNGIGSPVGYVVFLVAFVACMVTYLATPQDAQTQRRPVTKGSLMTTDLTREELTQRAATLGPPVHAALEKPKTVVERIPTPFFTAGAIYRVGTRPPDRPRLYVLGVWGKDGIKVLNNDPTAFFDVAANSGLKLTTGSDYVDYVVAFLESTRDFTSGPQILKTIEEAWWLRKLKPEEARKREEIIAKYAKVVEAPKLSREADATVVVYAIIDRKLLRLNAKVESGGAIDIIEVVLEPEMPTVMLR